MFYLAWVVAITVIVVCIVKVVQLLEKKSFFDSEDY